MGTISGFGQNRHSHDSSFDRRLKQALRLLVLVIIALISSAAFLPETVPAETQSPELLEAKRLNQEVEVLSREGKYAQAIPRAERVISILERAFGPDDIVLARLLNNLAGYYRVTGSYQVAELRYKRSLAIAEARLGSNDRIVALCLGNLAGLYHLMGDYVRAEQFYKRTLTVAERSSAGEPTADLASALINLAAFYGERGDYDQDEQLLQRAITVSERLPRTDPSLASALDSLGFIYVMRMDYLAAKTFFKRAMSLTEGIAAVENQQLLAISLGGQGRVYEQEGNFILAQPFYETAVSVMEKALGSDAPSTATSLNNLGLLYMELGDNKRALPVLERALAIEEGRYGKNSIQVVSSLINISRIYEQDGDINRAANLLVRGFNIRERTLRSILATGSERQKRLYLATLSQETDGILSMMVEAEPQNKELIDLALTSVLRRKGRALDTLSDQIGVLRRRANVQDAALLDELSVTKGQLANIMLDPSRNGDDRQAYTATLERRIDELEGSVAAHSDEFRQQLRSVTLDRLQSAIPAGAALVEIASYHPFDPGAVTQAKRFGEARYIAFVLHGQGNATWVELGNSARIDERVRQFRAAIQNSKSLDTKKLGRALDEQVMQPIRPLLGDSRQILVSPDGGFNLIPFGALVEKQNRYLIENYSITYLTSGRDLLRSFSSAKASNRPLIIANPLFDGLPPNNDLSERPLSTPAVDRSIDFTKFKYPPLPNTALEAKEIAGILTDAEVLTEAKATERAVKSSVRPRILHIATHGFFLEDQKASTPGERALVRERTEPSLENPLLRSGLILAGVTRRNSGAGEDGVLSALETATLDLRGTQLVVLSACETGMGDVKIGDGVFGLRRALVLAGAESQVTSLWQVDDKATRDLMVDFYTRLQRSEERGEALRDAELTIMRTEGREHPYFWASFIEVGDWRSMHGN
jgi:CHAT domain-containing protein/Tfp pilus assembly protein PilF